MLHKDKQNEGGQSILIIAFVVLVLLALVALVVDVGNAYAHRRMVQNAVDAAALAGVRKLAERGVNGQTVLEIQVLREIKDYAEDNSLNRDDVRAWFINRAGDRIETIDPWAGPVSQAAQGVEVDGDLPFATYFAQLIGFPTMTAGTNAKAWVLRGPCSGDNLFPVIVSANTFGSGGPQLNTDYTLWDHDDKHAPGNFGWIYWEDGDGVNHCPDGCPQGPQVPVLGPNIVDTSRSGDWRVGEEVHGDPGVNFQPVLDELAPYIQGADWPEVVIPVYGGVTEQGNSAIYEITGFAAFRLRCAFSSENHYVERTPGACDPCQNGSSSDKCIIGEFVRMVEPSGDDGCMDTGIVIPSFRKPSGTP
jgi:hypothetical protein